MINLDLKEERNQEILYQIHVQNLIHQVLARLIHRIIKEV